MCDGDDDSTDGDDGHNDNDPGGYSGFRVTGRCEWGHKLECKKVPWELTAKPKKIP